MLEQNIGFAKAEDIALKQDTLLQGITLHLTIDSWYP
jgi:hypothetical protein